MITKICSLCRNEKPLTDFPERKMGGSYKNLGTAPWQTHEDRCRPCKAEYARNWRKTHTNYRGTGKQKSIPKEDRFLVSAIGERLFQAKERTKKYNQPTMDIDRDYLYQLFKEQGGCCALSGVTLRIEKRAVACLSLDQKVAGLGYIKGNVQWVAWAVNRAKGDMSEEVFIDMCRQILEHQKVQRLSKSSES